MAQKLVVHHVHQDQKTFTDVTDKVGDVSNLSASALAAKLADFAKNNNLNVKALVAESVEI